MYSNTYMTNKIRNQLRNLDKFTAKKFGLKEWDWIFFSLYKMTIKSYLTFFRSFLLEKNDTVIVINSRIREW